MRQSVIMLMIALFTTVSMSAQSNGDFKQNKQNNKKRSNTEKVYIKSKNATTFHKSKECKKIKDSGNIKSITFEKAMDRDLEPCTVCYGKPKDNSSKNYKKNSNDKDNDRPDMNINDRR